MTGANPHGAPSRPDRGDSRVTSAEGRPLPPDPAPPAPRPPRTARDANTRTIRGKMRASLRGGRHRLTPPAGAGIGVRCARGVPPRLPGVSAGPSGGGGAGGPRRSRPDPFNLPASVSGARVPQPQHAAGARWAFGAGHAGPQLPSGRKCLQTAGLAGLPPTARTRGLGALHLPPRPRKCNATGPHRAGRWCHFPTLAHLGFHFNFFSISLFLKDFI